MTEAQKKARVKYEEVRTRKSVSFHLKEESELLQFADSVNFSVWVKQKIKEEIYAE